MRMRLVVVLVLLLASVASPRSSEPAGAQQLDALQQRTLAELKGFTDWLDTYNAPGYLGETGWPDDYRGDADEWNALAEMWWDEVDAAGLTASVWSTGEWWGPYPLAVYEDLEDPPGVETVNTQAAVLENHLSTNEYQRSINVSTGTFCEGEPDKRSDYSNKNPGRYDRCYHYDTQETFDFIASRGWSAVRLEFRWESIQRKLGGPLHKKDMERLEAVVQRAHNAGLEVILSMHNFGAYYLYNGKVGVRRGIGSRQVPIKYFADVWEKLSLRFKDVPDLDYVIMSEPYGMPETNDLSGPELWERASQAALDAVRATGDTHTIYVCGYFYASTIGFTDYHPDPWIVDPLNNFAYEVHHYWDRDHSGGFDYTYAEEVAYAENHP